MAQQTFTQNATASLTANGTSTATGSITWTAPALPEGATSWDSVIISGSWTWNGKGNISRVTINGTNTSADTPFSISIAGKTSPLSITCVGGNKNATGANFQWSNLVVTYVCTVAGGVRPLTVRYGSTTIITDEVEPPVAVGYNSRTIVSVEEGQTKTLTCAGKIMATNVTVGTHTLTCAGKVMNNNVTVEVS